jgi:arylsulfatase A-like enzyme
MMLRRIALVPLLILLPLPGLAAGATRPNIVLITLDSVRADRVGFLGAKRPTPTLDAMAKQAIVFERAYAQAPLTVVSHGSILTGTYPQTSKLTEFGSPLGTALPYLPEILKKAGYKTAAFTGSIALDPRNGLAPGFDRGFDTYDAGFHWPTKGEGRAAVARRGEQVASRAAAWLAQQKQPFFLWVHLSDAQAPYAGGYDGGVASEDAALGKVLAAMKAQKLLDDAIVVVAADHGESLGEHGEETHGVFLYDETIRVPLLLKLAQNQMAGRRVSGHVRLVDVAPTVLEAAGVPVPPQMEGQSLLRAAKTNADQPVYSRSDFPQRAYGWSGLESWRAGKYLYIRAPKAELYDLTADPGAAHNLAQSSKGTADTMASQLESFDRHFTSQGKGAELTSSEMQKLASLGYVGLQKPATGAAATGTDPKDEIATANKVQAAIGALETGEAGKAAAALRPVIEAQPGLYLAQYGLGVALARQGDFKGAAEHLHKAVELQPDSAWANYEMGAALLKTGDAKTAAVHLEIATSRLPEFAGAHTLLAEAYDKLGRGEDARRERKAGAQ